MRLSHPAQQIAFEEYRQGVKEAQRTPAAAHAAITKTGKKHARRILVEAAWNYRFAPRVSRDPEVRQQEQPQLVRKIAWRAQLRLSARFRHLRVAHHLPQNKVCIAIARELAGFIWDIGQHVKPLA